MLLGACFSLELVAPRSKTPGSRKLLGALATELGVPRIGSHGEGPELDPMERDQNWIPVGGTKSDH